MAGLRRTQGVSLIDSKPQRRAAPRRAGSMELRRDASLYFGGVAPVRIEEDWGKDTVSEQAESNLRVCECGVAIRGNRLVHAQSLVAS